MCDLPKFESEQLLVGFESSDDAAVYQINDTQAIIQTLDFFTPIVDDPYDFGAIAATNALSDVYAMGGTPTLAMNIVAFPNCLDPLILKEILKGGADKVKEAEALLVGGHSIEDDEPKYGLSVMGLVAPDRIWKNIGAKIGDVLILTKPLGIGVLTTALKENLVEAQTLNELTEIMKTLNRIPTEILKDLDIPVHACTDVTGFGLIGHALEMSEGSDVSFVLDHMAIPIIEAAKPLAEMGIIPAGAYKNKSYSENKVSCLSSIEDVYMDLFFDPQTSGGLLLAIPEADALRYLTKLKASYKLPTAVIGYVVKKESVSIRFV